jgi:hypothetical protein
MAVEMDFAMVARSNIKDRLQSRLMTEDPSRAPACQFDVVGIFKKTADAADLRRRGRDVAADMRETGGIPLLMKTLLDNGHLHGDCITVSGRPIAEDLKSVEWNPRCAPGGAIGEVTGMSKLKFAGPAGTIDREADAFDSIHDRTGRIVLLRGGDSIGIASDFARSLNVKLTGATLTKRRTRWTVQKTNHRSGALWKDAHGVGPAVNGAVIHSGAHEKCYAEI